ncbi:replication-associated protein [Bromus-associated circular DNA virus 2]|uniref:replication-associated protein n=1 Tax=Bromus-associated circular DNA virus 2 TaxID=1590155 RepID=UPI000585EA0A|nr:replication-associated protein [Bromus-associated circular DNA virus 2]AJC52525.1 replication-associated protein [Bromus-associated circular DNA virus 2]
MPSAVRWVNVCFTSFSEEPPTKGDKISYLIYQRERGNDTHREHWQGYAESINPKGWCIRTWQCELSSHNAHIECRKGTQSQAIEYCRKEETRLSGPFEFGEAKASKKRKGDDTDNVYREAGETASSAADYLRIVAAGDPKGFAKSFNSIKACAEHLFPEEVFPPYVAPPWCNKGWKLTADLVKWVEQELPRKDRPKCLVLVGPSRLGKTQWARSLGRHMYWRGMTNVTHWDSAAKYLIFDDIEWKFIPQKKSLLTCMGSATVTDKYKGKRDIIVDKPAIVLCNEFDIDSIEESAYWARNLQVVHVSEPLFDTTQLAIAQ